MKTVLCYVLSSHEPPYAQMIKTAQDTWDDSLDDNIRVVYYCGNPMGGDTDRVISFPVDESYETIWRKNLLAFRHALRWPWSYMARVNSSCYVHKRRLLEHVQTLPETGVMKCIVSDPTPSCGVSRQFAWGGGQFIFSRDIIGAFVLNSDKWRHDVMEDVAMSELAQDCGFTLDSTGRFCSVNRTEKGWNVITYNGKPGFEFTDFAEMAKVDDQFFFRCKHDPDRNVDADVMRLLKACLPR